MYEEANYGIKECPVCHARCFADMDVCYGCLHPFTQDDAQVISQTIKEDLESELDLQVNQASDDQIITPPVHVRAQTAQGDSYEIVISVRVPGNVLS